VHTVGGLSAHADQSQLMNWYDSFQARPPLVLVHGEPRAQTALRDRVRDEFAAAVHIAEQGEVFDLGRPIPFQN
jgi:metallo-beta-lactamase family protein